MSKQRVSAHPQTMFQNEEHLYFEKLEKVAMPLRHCAREMVSFINHLEHQTPALRALKQSYLIIESLPVKDLNQGLVQLKHTLANIAFIKDDTLFNAKNQPDFIGFYEIQNHFNTEVNSLVRHGMSI